MVWKKKDNLFHNMSLLILDQEELTRNKKTLKNKGKRSNLQPLEKEEK